MSLEFSWELIGLTVGSSVRRGEQRFRLRIRTERGEKATEVTPAELPARIAELCERLGVEGIMTQAKPLSLTALAAEYERDVADLERQLTEREEEFAAEVRELREQIRVKRLEVRELARAASRLARITEGKAARVSRIKAPATASRPAAKRHKRKAGNGPTAHDQIVALLPATVDDLAAALDKPRAVIARSVGQLAKSGRVARTGDMVRLAKAARAA